MSRGCQHQRAELCTLVSTMCPLVSNMCPVMSNMCQEAHSVVCAEQQHLISYSDKHEHAKKFSSMSIKARQCADWHAHLSQSGSVSDNNHNRQAGVMTFCGTTKTLAREHGYLACLGSSRSSSRHKTKERFVCCSVGGGVGALLQVGYLACRH